MRATKRFQLQKSSLHLNKTILISDIQNDNSEI